jgi:CubicO group peptidase (beta-lactamase class C family)
MDWRFEDAVAAAIGEGKIAGAVALAVDRGGIVYEHAAGVRAAGQPAAMSRDTVFWIASMTKALTSVAALQLVEQGRLSLDGDLTALLPEFAALQVLEGIEDGRAKLRPARSAPTLRQLLTHTAGFAYAFTDPRLAAYAASGGVVSGDTRAAHAQPLMFDPGEGWTYGINIDWAGVAIEAASGRRLDAYMAEAVLGPLGMADTSFGPRAADAGRRAALHVKGPNGELVATPLTPTVEVQPEVISGGGGLYSTAPDYARFLQMLLNGGELDGRRLLAETTVRSLSEVHSGPYRAGAWTSPAPHVSHDFDPLPGHDAGHGLATLVNPRPGPHGRSAGSLAWAGLANTYYWADPAAGKAGVLMTQQMPFGDPAVLDLLAALERGVYGC